MFQERIQHATVLSQATVCALQRVLIIIKIRYSCHASGCKLPHLAICVMQPLILPLLQELTAAFTPSSVLGTTAAYATVTVQPRGSLPGSPYVPTCTVTDVLSNIRHNAVTLNLDDVYVSICLANHGQTPSP